MIYDIIFSKNNKGGKNMQQILMTMRAEDNQITADYNSLILSFIKAALHSYDREIYEDWYGKNTVKRKMYTYSVSMSHPKFENGHIELADTLFKVYISTYDMGEYIILYNAVNAMRKKKYSYKDNIVQLEDVSAMNVPLISSDSVIVRADSSIIARKHTDDNKDVFLSYSDENFSQTILNTIEMAVKDKPIRTTGFKIEPVDAKKTVIYHYGMRINANIGTYRLTGTPELLNFLILSGIGSATNSGHGKIRPLRG